MRRTTFAILALFALLAAGLSPASAAITVKVAGPGGEVTRSLPDSGGSFEVKDFALNKNALNSLTVTAVDDSGNTASQELKIAQLSLESIVVSQITAERLSPEEVKQLVADGVIDLKNPENYNVSTFTLVLTVRNEQVPISVTLGLPKDTDEGGYEDIRMPPGDNSGAPAPQPQEILILEDSVSVPGVKEPVSIPGILFIEGRIKSLKEFYAVRLLLLNTSGLFTLDDVTARIEFPDGGLTSILPADGLVSFGQILPGDGGEPGQAQREFIIRGDEIGLRGVKVGFAGVVAGPGIATPVPFRGSGLASVEVKGPPTFRVEVAHPDTVEADVPYDLTIRITNTGESPALYASLELDMGADGKLVRCVAAADPQDPPECVGVEGSDVRPLGHLLPGETVTQTFQIIPKVSGEISSCLGIADQNVTLQVLVGTKGCLVGRVPPRRASPDGAPTVSVVPAPNAFGVSPDSPVTAVFSVEMDPASLTTGDGGSFNVYTPRGALVAGQLRSERINGRSVVFWQVPPTEGGRLTPNVEYSVVVTKNAKGKDGKELASPWTSTFTTTDTGINDTTPPEVHLMVEPPVNADAVLPGQLVTVNAYATDQGSGVVRVELRIKDKDTPGAKFTLVDQKTVFLGDKPPYLFALDSGNLEPGHTYELMATAFDYVANAQNATLFLLIAQDASPPTVTLSDDPAAPVLQGISVSLTPSVTGGVKEVRYYLDSATDPYKTVYLYPYQASLRTLDLELGPHTIRAEALDGLGQTGDDTYTFTLTVNVNKPTVSFPGSTPGARYLVGTAFSVEGRAEDPVGIASTRFYLDTPSGTPLAEGTQPFRVNTAGLTGGEHRIVQVAVNSLGVSNDPADPGSSLAFTVAELPNGPPPDPPELDPLAPPDGGAVTVSGTTAAGARVDVTNVALALTVSLYADGSGRFSGAVAADGGQTLRAVAWDFSRSQQPSAAASALVPVPPVLERVTVNPDTLRFTQPQAYADLTVTGHYADGSSRNLTSRATFSSNYPAVATVSSTGRVAAESNGTAAITAAVGSLHAQAAVEVALPFLTGLRVTPDRLTFPSAGMTQRLEVEALFSDGSSRPLAGGVSFESGNETVATVSATGVATAVADGTTAINVFYPGAAAVTVPVSVDTTQDTAPTATLQSPADGTRVEPGSGVQVVVAAADVVGGVSRVFLEASGQAVYSSDRQIVPPQSSTSASFSFSVPGGATLGQTITVRAWAVDVSGKTSDVATITLQVADLTAPAVAVTAPANGSHANFGDTVTVTVSATDAVGVSRLRYETTGGLVASGSVDVSPAAKAAERSFQLGIPAGGLAEPSIRILAFARDEAGNEGSAAAVEITVTGTDITPPQTRATAVSDPGSGATTTVTYRVFDGLADLDHVELYFRRNGLGTFNRYTDAGHGNPQGKFTPQSGDTGTVLFDSTQMGGDGDYEFYTVGVDRTGNREPQPSSAPASPTDYAGLVAYHPFDGSALDASGNGNDGTLVGGAFAPDRAGLADRALSLDGTGGYVGIGAPVPASLQLQDEITLAAWIYVSQYPNSDTLGLIVGCQYDPTRSGYSIHLDGRKDPDGNTAPAGHIHFQIGDHGFHQANANTQVPLNEWVHVVATRKANEDAKIYYSGVLQPSAGVAWGGTITYDGAEFDIGRQSDYGNRYFKGLLDDVAVYGRALSETEIQGFFPHFVPDQTLTFQAGTVWSEVLTPLTLGAGDASLENANVRVRGTTLTLNGRHSFHNVELLEGAVLTHPDTDLSTEYHLDLDVWTLTIDSASSINVDGRGYLGGNRGGNDCTGHTEGNTDGATFRSGGSHGGLGGVLEGAGSNPTYGSLSAPASLGSGGSCGAYSYAGGDGGGRVVVRATNVVVDGPISADGASGTGQGSGSGSGGTVAITAATLSGSGTIRANGGAYEEGGGGGRIAIIYQDLSLASSQVQALGGQGNQRVGGNGTVFLKGPGQTNGDLIVDGLGQSTPIDATTLPAGYSFDRLLLRNAAHAVADGPLQIDGTLELSSASTLTASEIRGTGALLLGTGSVLTHPGNSTAGLTLAVRRIEVDATTSIDVTGKGYPGGNRGSLGCPGTTLGGLAGAASRSGGSYGGFGGVLAGTGSNPTYGHPAAPIYLGSGGSCGAYSYLGGNGGGLLKITVTDQLVVNGSLLANGAPGTGAGSGSGSGGSIDIRAGLLRGTGSIRADGGAYEEGGGGGRIAISYDSLGNAGDDLDGLRSVGAFGGRGNQTRGGAGTVWFRTGVQALGDLVIDDNMAGETAPVATALTHVGVGEIASLTADTLTLGGAARVAAGGLVGLEVNPNVGQGQTYTIVSNTETTITVDTVGKPALTAVAAAGDTYAGIYRFDNVTLRRGGYLVQWDKLIVPGTLGIDDHGVLTQYDATLTFEPFLDLTVGTLAIASTGSINVDGRGYLGGNRDGNDCTGHTQGNTDGSVYRSGGSYGGLGGVLEGAGSNPTYGSLTEPVSLGSGGSCGAYSYAGGDGGGRVVLRATHVVVDGTISANGADGTGAGSGSGSGGTIALTTVTLSGGGTIRANGGAYEEGGGGGRIAILYQDLNLTPSQVQALGGQGNQRVGGNGTVFLKGPGQANGDLIVDGLGQSTPGDATTLPAGYAFDRLLLRNGAHAVAPGPLRVDGTLEVSEASTLTASEIRGTGALLLGTGSVLTHPGNSTAGLTLEVRRIEVDATSSIDVSGKGYPGGNRTSLGCSGTTLGGLAGAVYRSGGSYGGSGGVLDGPGSNVPYGHPSTPLYLGSGGSCGAYSYLGGNGGGLLKLTASDELVVNGSLLANGDPGTGASSGSGSGGSIVIRAGLLRGSGVIAADGGAFEVGGGGGRIAVSYNSLGGAGDDLDGLRSVGAFGGRGNRTWGSAGTVWIRTGAQVQGDLYLDDNMAGATSPVATALTHVGVGKISSLTADTLTLDGAAKVVPGGLAGLEVNPNVGQDETYTVVSNTEATITVDTAGKPDLTAVAAAGDTYAGIYRFDNVTLRRGGYLVQWDKLIVGGTLKIDDYGMLTQYDATLTFEPFLDLTVGTLEIPVTGSINVDGRGYLGGNSGGNDCSGQTEGSPDGSTYRSGGSYGGLGGVQEGTPNPTYGSPTAPASLGSGGSCGDYSYAGGDGGGRVVVHASRVVVDGTISANGAGGAGAYAGSGSGGTISLATGTLSGSGTIRANGGGTEVGGGGGRVAIQYVEPLAQPLPTVQALGAGSQAAGADGTVWWEQR